MLAIGADPSPIEFPRRLDLTARRSTGGSVDESPRVSDPEAIFCRATRKFSVMFVPTALPAKKPTATSGRETALFRSRCEQFE